MKKHLYSLLALALLFVYSSDKAKAQVLPGIHITAAGDTIWNTLGCGAPDTIPIYGYGSAGGYLTTDSALVYIGFGDGTDTTFYTSIAQQYFYIFLDHIYTQPGVYSLLFIVTGPDGAADTLAVNNTILVGTQCGNITGQVYYDANNDCAFNAGDVAAQWAAVQVMYGGAVIATSYCDANGYYNFSVPTGFTYTVGCSFYNSNLTVNCPAGGTYTVSTLPSTGNDFATGCVTPGFDLSGNLYAWGVRPGLAAFIYPQFWNEGCMPVSGTVTITLPAGVSFVSSNPAPTSVSGQVLTYTVAPYSSYWGYNWGFINHIEVLGDPSLNIGDTLCFTMVIDPIAGDTDPSDNTITTCVPVRNSCDPNEKFEATAKWGTANVAPGARLNYTVGFQNVGNDVAYKVVVTDQLDSDVDMNTLEITSASHPMNIYMMPGNKLKFEFLNINLAASSVNEPLSHGFITYKVNAKSGLANGTAIDNSAEIFFDFNAPIVTNNVKNIIDIALGLNEQDGQLMITTLPNPATDYIRINTGNTSLSQVSLFDMNGKMVVKSLVEDKGTISLTDVNKGVYMVKVISNNKTYTGKIVVLK